MSSNKSQRGPIRDVEQGMGTNVTLPGSLARLNSPGDDDSLPGVMTPPSPRITQDSKTVGDPTLHLETGISSGFISSTYGAITQDSDRPRTTATASRSNASGHACLMFMGLLYFLAVAASSNFPQDHQSRSVQSTMIRTVDPTANKGSVNDTVLSADGDT
ncbi:hypothetical protein M231_08094 [Tremella mesenterica]|uniref:Uncharacterized protein n=1 Tax=Tremella mesenterica TaxID=5217 RepID=A0A4V1M2V1_TREME|nr:hypothetical protein M231_08094 [Tremella mesenterica]